MRARCCRVPWLWSLSQENAILTEISRVFLLFSSLLFSSFSPLNQLTAKKVEKKLAGIMYNKFANVQDAFRLFDEDKSGSVNYEEFRSILDHYGLSTSDSEFAELVKSYDHDGDGKIAYSEFNERLGKMLYPEYNDSWVQWSEKKGRKVTKAKNTTITLDATAAEKALADKMVGAELVGDRTFLVLRCDAMRCIETFDCGAMRCDSMQLGIRLLCSALLYSHYMDTTYPRPHPTPP